MDKVREREGRKGHEVLRKKLMRRVIMVGRRGGNCTPPPTWRLEFPSQEKNDHSNTSNSYSNSKLTNSNNCSIQEFVTFPTETSVSARKLCANLWQILPHCPVGKMIKAADGNREGGCTRTNTHRNCQDKKFDLPRHHVHHPSDKAVPYKLAPITRDNSRVLKGKTGESSYTLKISTELLKLLNHVWSLEEEHATSFTMVKDLKRELNSSQAQIKKLIRQRQKDKIEMDALLNRVSENKQARKRVEMESIKIAVQSARKELEDERSLRKHSESLHRKLSRQLVEIKSLFSNEEEELEKEREARILLERLCDEFAKGIRDYEDLMQSLGNAIEKDEIFAENPSRLVLHIAEAWLDVRQRMKSEESTNYHAENSIIGKLGHDIKTFFQAKQSVELRDRDSSFPNHLKGRCMRQHSSESFQLNEVANAPRVGANEEDYLCCNTKKLGVNKNTCAREMNVLVAHQHDEKSSRDHLGSSLGKKTESVKNTRTGSIPCEQLHLDEQINENQFEDRAKIKVRKQNQTLSIDSDKSRTVKDVCQSNPEEVCESNTSDIINSIAQNHSVAAQGDRYHLKATGKETSSVQFVYRGPSSPVKQWMSISSAPHIDNKDSLTIQTGVQKDNTLKVKLMEARLDGHHRRIKASRASV